MTKSEIKECIDYLVIQAVDGLTPSDEEMVEYNKFWLFTLSYGFLSIVISNPPSINKILVL